MIHLANAAEGMALGFLLREWWGRLGILDLVPFRSFLTAGMFLGLVGLAVAVTVGPLPLWVLLAVTWLARVVVARTGLAGRLARSLVRRDAPEPAPAVVALAADDRYFGGELAARAQQRFLGAYEVVRQGLAPRMIITRLPPPNESYLPRVCRQLAALRLDLPVEEVGPVRTTRDEAVAVAALAREQGWNRVILVTHPWHMRRAASVFERAGLPVTCLPCESGEFDCCYPHSDYARERAFRTWMREAVGYQVYRWRGWV